MQVCERTGQDEFRAKATTTATGFWRWVARFEEEVNDRKAEHFYLAQIASELACVPWLVWGKEPPKELRDLNNWMLKFGAGEDVKERLAKTSEERRQQDAEFSKSVWLGVLGLNDDGTLRHPVVTRRPPDMPDHIPTPGALPTHGPFPHNPPEIELKAPPGPDVPSGGINPPPRPDRGSAGPLKRKKGVRVFNKNGEEV